MTIHLYYNLREKNLFFFFSIIPFGTLQSFDRRFVYIAQRRSFIPLTAASDDSRQAMESLPFVF